MRTIRAILNKAIKDGLSDKKVYPFADYTIKTKPTRKRAISYEAIQKILSLKLEPSDPLFNARNFFILSFYLMGAPFIDLAFLKVSSIADGRVQYKRKKTSKYYDIKITPNLEKILHHYIRGKKEDDYILPIIKRAN